MKKLLVLAVVIISMSYAFCMPSFNKATSGKRSKISDLKQIDDKLPICAFIFGSMKPITSTSQAIVYGVNAKSCKAGKARTALYKLSKGKYAQFIEYKKGDFSPSAFKKLEKMYLKAQ